MKLSLGLPHYGRESSPEVIARFAHEAEQLDYDAVWALERLLRPLKLRSAPFPGWTPPAYIFYNKVDKGGHFAAWEQPEILVNDLRAAFKSLR